MSNLEFNDAPPIIKKVKKGEHGHHGGAWKVAYADFVTAMMALFIVLWVLGQSEEVKQAVAGYFQNPSGIAIGAGAGVLQGGNKIINDQKAEEIMHQAEEKAKLTKMGEEIVEQLNDNAEFSDLQGKVDVKFTDEGMTIELVESVDEAFFEVGTAVLNKKAFDLVETIGKKFSTINNNIIVEGHTDARPYPNKGEGYTNFELSADRANSARRALVMGGVKEDQVIEIRGWADKKLRNPSNPFDVYNRRVTIIVKYSDKK